MTHVTHGDTFETQIQNTFDPHNLIQMGRRPRWESDPDGKVTQMGK